MRTGKNKVKETMYSVIDKTFEQYNCNRNEFINEINSINNKLSLKGANAFCDKVINNYFAVNIDALSEQNYVLIFSLNNKYYIGHEKRHSRLENRTHYETDLVKIFEEDKIYKFFTRFKSVLQSFSGDDYSDAKKLINNHAFFIEHLPYWSTNTPRIDNKDIDWDNWLGAKLSKELFHSIIEYMPPKAIILNGKNTHNVLDSDPIFNGIDFEKDNIHGKEIYVSTYNNMKIVKCNFVGTVYGPNSNVEKESLGKLLRSSY